MQERRKNPRRHGIRSGRILLGRATVECAILDISVTGARVYLPEAERADGPILFAVMLQLPDGTRLPARRRWQSGSDIGFEFQPHSHSRDRMA